MFKKLIFIGFVFLFNLELYAGADEELLSNQYIETLRLLRQASLNPYHAAVKITREIDLEQARKEAAFLSAVSRSMFPEDAAIKVSALAEEEREKFMRDLTNYIDPVLVLDALKRWGKKSELANEHFKKRIRPCEDLFLNGIFKFSANDDELYDSLAGYPFWFKTEDFNPIEENQQKIKDLIRKKDKKALLDLFKEFYEKKSLTTK